MNPAERILRTLARHLRGEAHIRLLGGAGLALGYGLDRTTEDADLVLDDQEVALLIERADFGVAIEATKLCRVDDGDLDDMRFLVEREGLGRSVIAAEMHDARVPLEFRDVFASHCERALAALFPTET